MGEQPPPEFSTSPELGIQEILFGRMLAPEEIESEKPYFYIDDYDRKVETLLQRYEKAVMYTNPPRDDGLSMAIIRDQAGIFFVFDKNQKPS